MLSQTEMPTAMAAGYAELATLLAQLARTHTQGMWDNHGQAATARAQRFASVASTLPLAAHPAQFSAYLVDAAQRATLTMDALRRRGDVFLANEEAGMPPVLDFAYEVILDGKTLRKPANYVLVKIAPPAGVTIDPAKRPFMIIDPRAGHGAGIGGFKPESQVGEAFEDGHAVYFVIFRPKPEPGQTLADVRDAEAAFLDEIRRRHPEAEKPVVIGNCQGGWGSMILASYAPDKVGPLAINGAPVAYWAGERGKNPMRYLGGLVGGVTPALVMSDLGGGLFDGSLLVQNFEQLNPANTYWKKLYGLYANVDHETERFLEFERWWGGFFMMTEAEIRWIVENLFVGNRLAHGQAILGRERVDLRHIRSPIIVFASHGDNITPPQQALNWIADLYRDETEIKALGQRIVYMVHPTIGHLGIFVSAKIAGREHDAITDTMRAIEALPPGLYEMVLEEGSDRTHIKFAPRRLADIMALDDGRGDEEMFAAVAQLSEFSAKTYDTFIRPFVKPLIPEAAAKQFFASRPLRVERAAISSRNPLIAPVEGLAQRVREERQPVAADNPFLMMEKLAAEHIEQSLNLFRDWRDAMQEMTFHMLYANPVMRMIGAQAIKTRDERETQDLLTLPDVRRALERIEIGGEAEGTVRILELLSGARSYVRRGRLEKALSLFETEEPFRSMDDTARAKLIHEQSLIVLFAPDEAKASLPKLLDTVDERRKALDFVMRVAGPAETMHPNALELYREIEAMLTPEGAAAKAAPAAKTTKRAAAE